MSPGSLAHAEQIARDFEFGSAHVRKAAHHFVAEMRQGLLENRAIQIPSYVTKIPTGREKGVYLAVDLGGTYCRVCLVHFNGDSTYNVDEIKHVVPREVRVNPSYKPLFAFIATRIGDFLEQNTEPVSIHDTESHWQLGFTFSFTFEQDSLDRGTVIRWDKGWDIPAAIGRNPCEMLQRAIDERGISVHVVALTNDSVGTLMTRSYTSGPSTLVAAIFGTGTNAAYVERLSNVKRVHDRKEFQSCEPDDFIVLNTEWGAFGGSSDVLPTTKYDDLLDLTSSNAKDQMLEKRVSGLYLGELLRLVTLELFEAGTLDMAVGDDSPVRQMEGVDGSLLSHLASDESQGLEGAISHITRALGVSKVSVDDARAIRVVAMAIARRAARLSGAALAAVIMQSERLGEKTALPNYGQITYQEKELGLSGVGGIFEILLKYFSRLRSLVRGILRSLGFQRMIRSGGPPLPAPVLVEFFSDDVNIIDIGVDGSLVEFYPTFEADIRGALREIPEIGPEGENRVRIGPAKNGSSVGAALVAQSASL